MPEQVANGVRLHYQERGEGDPSLCIHGAGSSALVWAKAAEKLAGVGRVIACSSAASPPRASTP
jgi:pimeloyl-ACP methyl ester carboxylesterase